MIRNVAATACRYNGLRDCALEIYFQDASSVLFAFERKRDREQLLRFLPRQAWSFTDKEFLVAAVQAWRAHQISNYDYLLALNAAAGRSFQDLSRYPGKYVLDKIEEVACFANRLSQKQLQSVIVFSLPVGCQGL
jgi:factor associated with neutral sphingomyelinase activation